MRDMDSTATNEQQALLGRLTLVGKALSFTHELSFFLALSINPPCSEAAQ